MKAKVIFYLVVLSLAGISCKESRTSPSKVPEAKTTGLINKKDYPIPSNLKIENKEEINIDNDVEKEVIITATSADADYAYEFWFKNDQLIYEFSYPWCSINKKWLVNLDDDEEKEIVRIQGHEDGADYAIYDIAGKQQKPILYFNPVLEDNRFPDQYMWAYPNDIAELVINQKKELQVSLHNNYQREDEHTQPDHQKELPFIFFTGHTSQPDRKIFKMNKSELMTADRIINEVRKSQDEIVVNQKTDQQWIGTYSCRFLRMKEESGDPRGWGRISLKIDQSIAKFQLDSYIENVNKDFIIVQSTPDEISFAEKDDRNSTLTITKNKNKYILKSNLMNKTVGEISSYELKKD